MRLTAQRIEQLAAEYALGTLQGGARRRLETLARQHPELREAILRWQHQLAGLTELAPAVTPPPQLWTRIAAVLRADLALRAGSQPSPASAAPAAAPTAAPTATPRPAPAGAGLRRFGWGGWVAGLALLLLGGQWLHGSTQRQQLQQESQGLRQQLLQQAALVEQARGELAAVTRIGYVAVLADERAGPALLASFDAQAQRLAIRRIGAYREADEKSLQLWTLAPGQPPKSLGVLGRDGRELLRAPAGDVQEQRLLAVSLEPLGGVPSERGPTGPVLFKGPVLAL